jgi:hypothetical protein
LVDRYNLTEKNIVRQSLNRVEEILHCQQLQSDSNFTENPCASSVYLYCKLTCTAYCKGQLISKGLVGILSFSKKQMKKFNRMYYDTSGQLLFVQFLEELKTPRSPFEIN